jgi:predicted metal-dependent phosphotriesterase family hydrolase
VVACRTGVTYIHGTIYYTQATHPKQLADVSVEGLADEFVADIHAGTIGELGISSERVARFRRTAPFEVE